MKKLQDYDNTLMQRSDIKWYMYKQHKKDNKNKQHKILLNRVIPQTLIQNSYYWINDSNIVCLSKMFITPRISLKTNLNKLENSKIKKIINKLGIIKLLILIFDFLN
jgi:hypothetical protein